MKDDGNEIWFGGASPCLRLLALFLAGLALLVCLVPRAGAVGPGAFFRRRAASGGAPQRLVPVGHTVGIKLFSDGVLVVGLGEVNSAQGAVTPAKTCGLREGDIITHINSREVDTIEEVQSILQDVSGDQMSIRAIRGDTALQVTAQAVFCPAEGAYKLGAWIRDSMAGIGTMTFYDPATGRFGALGHGVSDVDTARLMPLESGSILRSSVTGVQKGEAGAPGQLRGAFDVREDLGSLYANTERGVFGTLDRPGTLDLGEALPVAARSEVRTGPALIRSNIAGDEVRDYAVEITRLYPAGSNGPRDLLLKVTDPALLEATGGIVQGMVVRYNRDNTGKP